jgi:dihydrofolate reductase
MTNFAYVATSLDGFIATPDDGLDWLSDVPNPDQSDFGFAEFMATIDAVVMGRRTFEKVLTFETWPYTKPVCVLSRTLRRPPDSPAGAVTLARGAPRRIVADLARRGYENLYVDGGRTIQGFLREDLIDELIITRMPVVLGRGIPLFGPLEHVLRFEHRRTEVYHDALVKSFYRRAR